MKKLGISHMLAFTTLLFLTLFLSSLNYFFKINPTFNLCLKLALPITSFFISSIYFGRCAVKKGYIEGLKLSMIYLLWIFLFTFLFKVKFKLIFIIFYLMVILSCMLGAMVGINTKKKEENL